MAIHWIVCLSAALPIWLLQNVIHELAHGLTAYLGWRWKFSIFPFPSKRLGRFTWSHVIYSHSASSRDMDDQGKALVALAPKIANAIFMVAAWIGAIFMPFTGRLLLAMFATANCVDFSVGLAGMFGNNKASDIWQFQAYNHLSVKWLRVAVAFMIIYMASFTAICNMANLGVF